MSDAPESTQGFPRIGTDEAGKGDYFGHLVAAAVWVNGADDLRALEEAGVRDSKRLSDRKVLGVAAHIRSHVPHEVVAISPSRYNDLYPRFGSNLNRMLAWAHARAIKSLLANRPCRMVVTDRFGDEGHLLRALGPEGDGLQVVQRPRAEDDPAVAAASILAREAFLKGLERLSDRIGEPLPKGATHVIEPARRLVARLGESTLRDVAKLHFKSTRAVLGTGRSAQ